MFKSTLFAISLLLSLLIFSGCGDNSSSSSNDTNLSTEIPPMFPDWKGELPK